MYDEGNTSPAYMPPIEERLRLARFDEETAHAEHAARLRDALAPVAFAAFDCLRECDSRLDEIERGGYPSSFERALCRAERFARVMGQTYYVLGPSSVEGYWTASREMRSTLWRDRTPVARVTADGTVTS